jgi:hypothetical protein
MAPEDHFLFFPIAVPSRLSTYNHHRLGRRSVVRCPVNSSGLQQRNVLFINGLAMRQHREAVVRPGKYHLCLLAAMALLLPLLPAGDTFPTGGPPLTGPRIRVEGEIFDFGYVPQQAYVSHTFWLKNPGTETVRIQRLAPNCGCTTAPLTDSVIAIGDSIPVQITFGSRSMIGQVEKHTRIFSNAAGRVPALSFRANVATDTASDPPLRVRPWAVMVDPADQPSSGDWSVPVALENNGKTAVEVRAIDFPPRDFSLSETKIALRPGEVHPVTITLAPLPEGSLGKSVTFELSIPAGVRLTVPIMRHGK